MKIRTIIVTFVLLVLVVFAGLNWPVFSASSSLNLGIRQVDAPLGLVLMAVIALLSVLFLALVGRTETAAWLDSRKNARELEQARKVAFSKEESRIYALQELVSKEFEKTNDKLDELCKRVEAAEVSDAVRLEGAELEARTDKAERELRRAIRQKGAA